MTIFSTAQESPNEVLAAPCKVLAAPNKPTFQGVDRDVDKEAIGSKRVDYSINYTSKKIKANK